MGAAYTAALAVAVGHVIALDLAGEAVEADVPGSGRRGRRRR
jgi:hypothetical protein